MIRANALQPGAPTLRLERLLCENHPPTPFIVLDLDTVRARYAALRQALPAAAIYYAVKANPAGEVIAALATLGAGFDLASPGELGICLGLGIQAQRLSFAGTLSWIFVDLDQGSAAASGVSSRFR